MYKFVDETEDSSDGFCYTNHKGEIEYLRTDNSAVQFEDSDDRSHASMIAIYYEDIPKAIRALQAAYDKWMKEH